jgi:hypothetical protein
LRWLDTPQNPHPTQTIAPPSMLQINLADAEIRLRDLLEILIAANMIEAVKQTLRMTC